MPVHARTPKYGHAENVSYFSPLWSNLELYFTYHIAFIPKEHVETIKMHVSSVVFKIWHLVINYKSHTPKYGHTENIIFCSPLWSNLKFYLTYPIVFIPKEHTENVKMLVSLIFFKISLLTINPMIFALHLHCKLKLRPGGYKL